MSGFFSKERITASHGYNRWLIPPAALAVHLCIGQAYAFSVFNEPLTRILGVKESLPEDWKLTTIGWIYSLAIVFLGLSAAFGGKWLEKVGPRRTMFTAACCFGGGFILSAIGIKLHQIWLLYLGYGVIGGCGLGLGYVSPVSTLIKWFPDRRGMATGMAIMGFGGGAMVGAPLSVMLMKHFHSDTSTGVMETFAVMGVLYFTSMVIGSLAIRIPPPDWKPAGWTPPTEEKKMVTKRHVHIDQALKTPQFYLLWLILCLNVTAGIGILGQASVMIQEMFKGRITPEAAAGFVGLLSLFNMGGRFVWSSASDFFGRKNTYFLFFALGTFLYSMLPNFSSEGNILLFIAAAAVILSMYGGGFSTIPAYLADIFGTKYVGGIHGRLLTAWSTAGVLGPVLVNYIREYQVAHGVAKADAYTTTLYIMACLLATGFVCNLLMREVHEKHYMRHDQVDDDSLNG
ncbi:MFS transporter [Novimethylophilus kurashikiensis]|uniref:MFS transporter n=1 Tax=Novimethylophilus kurashikiensis TaxID=1825523 RepID=A0A2R5FBT4_9PROT|nr:OFA family MFS transporter [Novimethylophilus kurashikiensis]GBG14151.1 MFS transporter [Novimethylophilus kurashikiensis]